MPSSAPIVTTPVQQGASIKSFGPSARMRSASLVGSRTLHCLLREPTSFYVFGLHQMRDISQVFANCVHGIS